MCPGPIFAIGFTFYIDEEKKHFTLAIQIHTFMIYISSVVQGGVQSGKIHNGPV